MMRQQMGNGKTETKGPRRVDSRKYAELAEQQTVQATEAIASQASTFSAGLGQSANYSGTQGQSKIQAQLERLGLQDNIVEEKKESGPVMNWRKGNFNQEENEPKSVVNLPIANIQVQEGGGKKKGKKKKGTVQVVSTAMPNSDEFPSLDDA